MKTKAFIFFVFILSLLIGCYSGGQLSQADYTYLYDPEQRLIKPEIKVYHNSQDSSELYFRIKTDDILYGRLQNDSDLTTRLLMRYRIFDYENKDQLIDSSTLAFIDRGFDPNTAYVQGKSSIYMPSGKLYRLRIHFRDEYKDLNTVYEYLFDKRLNGNHEFYLIKQGAEIVFSPVLNQRGGITIFKSPLIKASRFEMDSLSYNFKMTPPPFIEKVNSEELNFQFGETINFEDSINLRYIAGINRLIPYDSSLLRFHFFYFHKSYPYISQQEQMIEPIRYISTTSEYKTIVNGLNQKKEIDQFWLKIGKDENTARALIKEYYSRVEIANQNFTTYKEGWKTDRGIIFIVYGQPTTIKKDLNKESWIYGEENNILSVKFVFRKIRSEESDNIFVLERSEDFKSNWYRAVDDWRQGRISS